MIGAGDLTERVSYYEPTETVDSFGQSEHTWGSALFTCWARVRPLSGREGEIARQLRADATHAIDLRGPRTMKPIGRITWTDHNSATHTAHITEPARDVDGNQSHLVVIVAEVPDQA